MGFTIPNAPDASVTDQSEPDSGDFVALGDRKTGVISGCAVSAQGTADQTVQVAAGEVVSNGSYFTVSSNASLSLGQGSSSGVRFDIVVVDSSGALTVRTGTAGSNPTFPALVSGDVFLASVYRTSGTASTISSTQIIDKRVITPSNTARVVASAPSSGGNVGDVYVNSTASNITGQSQVWVKTGASLWENVAEFYYHGTRSVSSSTDSLLTTDINNFVEYSGACDISIATSANANFPTGCTIHIVKTGSTGTTRVLSGGSNVTVNSSLGRTLRAQYATATMLKRSDGTWLLFGDLTT